MWGVSRSPAPDAWKDDRMSADIGLIGLAVMGQNLVLNMADHGFTVAVYNRTTEVTDDFLAGPAADATVNGHHSVADLVADLTVPRKVMLMVKAGPVVDAVIEQLLPLLEEGDVIIDGGNSNHKDDIRRAAELAARGLCDVQLMPGSKDVRRRAPSSTATGTPLKPTVSTAG